MNVSEIVDMFNKAGEVDLIGGKTFVGLFVLGFVAFVAFRGRLGIDVVVVILAPMVIYLAWYGFLPIVLMYLTFLVIGFILLLGFLRIIT